MKTRIVIVLAAIILLCGGVGGFFIAKGIYKPKQAKVQLPVYFPVVVTVPKYIEKPVPYAQVIPAHVTTHYLAYADSMRLVKANDSLICLVSREPQTVHDTIKIHTKFLTAFPTSPKLINIDLNMDSISVTTLNINAELNTFRYPLALMGWRYRFDGKDMSVEKLKREYGTVKPKIFEWELNAYAVYNILDKKFAAVGEAGVSIWKVKARVETGLSIEKIPQYELNFGIGYKFLK
jgi:hypothetical protein